MRALALCVALAPAACRAPRAQGPLELSFAIESALDQHAGALLTGSVIGGELEAVEPDPADALALRFELFYVEDRPPTTLPPLAERTRLVAAIENATPILPTPELVRDARSGSGAEAERLRAELDAGLFGRVALVSGHTAALPRRSTAVLALGAAPDAEGASPESQLFVHVSRGEEELALCLGRRDLSGERLAWSDAPGPSVLEEAPRWLQHELVLLGDRPELDGAPLALVMRSTFPGEGSAFLLFVSLASSPDAAADPAAAAAHAEAMERCLASVRESSERARERAEPGSVEVARRRGIARVLGQLGELAGSRATIVSLASASGARVALDLALAADEAALRAFAQSVASELAPAVQPEGELPLGWLLDRQALLFLAREQVLGEQKPELEALLLLHTGQLGRYPGSVIEHLDRSADRAAFEEWVRRDNLELLSVPQLAERVRAYDWLHQRGAAPPGYDPLGPEDERRAALEGGE